jgi:proliferating cell nuclear antigen
VTNNNLLQEEDATVIELQQPVQLAFAVKYLSMFAKTTPLCNRVTLCLSSEIPLLIEYKIDEIGYIRYYLAPKVDSDE